MLSSAALALAAGDGQTIARYEDQIIAIERGMDKLLNKQLPAATAGDNRSRFYVNLNLLMLLWDSLHDCEQAAHKINWLELKQSRF